MKRLIERYSVHAFLAFLLAVILAVPAYLVWAENTTKDVVVSYSVLAHAPSNVAVDSDLAGETPTVAAVSSDGKTVTVGDILTPAATRHITVTYNHNMADQSTGFEPTVLIMPLILLIALVGGGGTFLYIGGKRIKSGQKGMEMVIMGSICIIVGVLLFPLILSSFSSTLTAVGVKTEVFSVVTP